VNSRSTKRTERRRPEHLFGKVFVLILHGVDLLPPSGRMQRQEQYVQYLAALSRMAVQRHRRLSEDLDESLDDVLRSRFFGVFLVQ